MFNENKNHPVHPEDIPEEQGSLYEDSHLVAMAQGDPDYLNRLVAWRRTQLELETLPGDTEPESRQRLQERLGTMRSVVEDYKQEHGYY